MALNIGGGDIATITFHNSEGALADPTVVTVVDTEPDGTISTYVYGTNAEVVRDSLGKFHYDVVFTANGQRTVRLSGTGAVKASITHTFVVGVYDPLDVLTITETKLALNNDVSDDTELGVYVTAASRMLDRYVGPIVTRTITDEAYDGGKSLILLRDVHTAPVAVTAVKEYIGTMLTTLTAESISSQTSNQYAAYDGILERRNGGYEGCFSRGRRNILVTYTVGRAVDAFHVDPIYKLAAKLIVHKMWSGKTAGAGDLFSGVEGAQYAAAIPSFAMPNAVKDLVGRDHVPAAG